MMYATVMVGLALDRSNDARLEIVTKCLVNPSSRCSLLSH